MSLEDKSWPILVVAHLQLHCGNNSTGNRITGHFEETEYACQAKDTDGFSSKQEFLQYLQDEKVKAIIGIHALHAGRWLKDSPVPYALILGGTDLNEYCKEPKKMAVMTEAMERARFIVTFSESMTTKAKIVWPQTADRPGLYRVIPQAIKTYGHACTSHDIRAERALPRDTQYLCMVGGIRPVKDPLFLLTAFSQWHQARRGDIHFLVIGPVREDDYGPKFLKVVDESPGVHFLGGRDMGQTHTIMRNSLALVNSSASEGMATAILEAMALGTPVIARDITGNKALVTHKKTGLLFHDPQEFLEQLECLLEDQELKDYVVKNAKQTVTERHDCKREKDAYVDIVRVLHSCETLSEADEILNGVDCRAASDAKSTKHSSLKCSCDARVAAEQSLLDVTNRVAAE